MLILLNSKYQITNPKLKFGICFLEFLNSYGGFAEGVHLFPYRTEQLSPSWPMVLYHNTGE